MAALTGSLDVGCGRLTGLGRFGLAREEDETLLVGFEALDVGGERLFGEVLAARVDRNTDGGRQLARDAGFLYSSQSRSLNSISISSYLQLGEREATASAHTAVVLDGRAADHRPQAVDRARCDLSSLLLASIPTALLATGL